MARTALYRHFDLGGRLLYVGISDQLAKRGAAHAAQSDWHIHVASTAAEWFDSRDEALVAEARAIVTERPLHNGTWNADGAKAAVRLIVAIVGADKICATLGVTSHSVRYALNAGSFSASWYAGLLRLCKEAGIDCPMALFNWKTASNQEAA